MFRTSAIVPGRRNLLIMDAVGWLGADVADTLVAHHDASGFNVFFRDRYACTHGQQEADHVFLNLPPEATPVWGLFLALDPMDTEEIRAICIINDAVIHGVRHVVYASCDRGGPDRSPQNPTPAPNMMAKHAVEQHLMGLAAMTAAVPAGLMTYTILRPVVLFDNLLDDTAVQYFVHLWKSMPERPLPMVARRDVACFAAQSFLQYPASVSRAVTIVGDILTLAEADKLFAQVVGRPMHIAALDDIRFSLRGPLVDIFSWLTTDDYDYDADMARCRNMHPPMLDFAEWLELNKSHWAHTGM